MIAAIHSYVDMACSGARTVWARLRMPVLGCSQVDIIDRARLDVYSLSREAGNMHAHHLILSAAPAMSLYSQSNVLVHMHMW